MDQSLGLLLLREFQPVTVYATPSVRAILTGGNHMFAMLQRVPDQVTWRDFRPGCGFEPERGLQVEPVPLPGGYPSYVPAETLAGCPGDEAVVGLAVRSGGRCVLFLPGVPYIDDALLARIEQCDLLLLDGTFWSDDEFIRVQPGARTARAMGHLPISGPGGSLERLARVHRPRKVYIHINNTNPILDEDSPEYQAARAAGWEVAVDGMTIDL